MSLLRAARLSRAPLAGMMAVGVYWGGFSVYIPDFKTRIGADDGALGLALMLSAAGSMLAMYLAPAISRRFGRAVLPLAGLVMCLSFGLPSRADTVLQFAAAMFGLGGAVACLDITTNMRISDLEERHGLHLMNLCHAMFSFAFAASALVASLARKAGWGAEDIIPYAAVGLAVLALATYEGDRWDATRPLPEGADHRGLWQGIWPIAAILFIAFVTENATDNWSALHIERTLGGAFGDGGFGPMMLGLAMGVGRMAGQITAARLGEAGLIFWSSVIGIAGACATALAPTPLFGIAGVGLMGLGVAVTVPSANSLLGRMVRPDQRGLAISRAWIVGFSGFFLGPVMMGQFSQAMGLRFSFLWLAVMFALILPLVGIAARRAAQE